MLELLVGFALAYAITQSSSHGSSTEPASDPSKYNNDALARTFVIPRNRKLERALLAELSQGQVITGLDAKLHAGRPGHAGSARYANSHALALPGGQLYIASGVDTHYLAQITNPYTHEVSR